MNAGFPDGPLGPEKETVMNRFDTSILNKSVCS